MEDDREEDIALAPPGFRFFPTEEELVSFYLPNKLLGTNLDLLIHRIIPVLDIYHYNPWDLPKNAGVDCRDEPEQWFFFVPRQESEARGGKPNRLTATGYWKATGSPGVVYSCNDVRAIGVKRTMVFYEGRAPEGKKTEWKMNEYKAFSASATNTSAATLNPAQIRQEFSLCRVYKKSKCLRTFDRRPSAPSQVISTRDDHDDMQGTAQQAQYRIGASPSSPSSIINVPTMNSVDDQPAAADQETNNLEIDVDYNDQEALWDWDWDCLQWD